MKQSSNAGGKLACRNTSKVVQLYLPTSTSNKQSKDISFKSQKSQGQQKIGFSAGKRSPKYDEKHRDLNIEIQFSKPLESSIIYQKVDLSQKEDKNQESFNKTKEELQPPLIPNQSQNKAELLEVIQQRCQFLETQLKDQQIKSNNTEKYYEQVLSVYKNLDSQTPLPTKSPINIQDQHLETLKDINIAELLKRVKELEEQKEEAVSKLKSVEQEKEIQASDYKFIFKDQKHQIQELQMKLKHNENKQLQLEEQNQRVIEDLKSKHDLELDVLESKKQLELQGIQERNQLLLDNLKDLQEGENRNLQEKIIELKGQIRMQELQIMEYQGQEREHLNYNIEALEMIHLRYLEEIKNLNITLGQFRTEKENEIKQLKIQIQSTQQKLNQSENSKKELSQKMQEEREKYEQKLSINRKKLDQAFKQMLEHEKCEITIQAQKKRLNELRYKLEQMEQKEKWQWKHLVTKRNQIENEKMELKRKIASQTRENQNKLISQSRVNDNLEKKVGILNEELVNTQNIKNKLMGQVNILAKEIDQLKVEQLNNSICLSTSRSIMTRSVSPRQAYALKINSSRVIGGGGGEQSILGKNTLNQTANLEKIIEKVNPKLKQNMKGPNYVSPRRLTTSTELSRKIIFLGQNLTSSVDGSMNGSPENNNKRGQKKEKSSQHLKKYIKNGGKRGIKEKSSEHKTTIDCSNINNEQSAIGGGQLSSFILSPKNEGISFISKRLQGIGQESTALSSSQMRSKAVSQYDAKCNACSKVFENATSYITHQKFCFQIEDSIQEQNSYIEGLNESYSPDQPQFQKHSSIKKGNNHSLKKTMNASSQKNLLGSPQQYQQLCIPINQNTSKSRNNDLVMKKSQSNMGSKGGNKQLSSQSKKKVEEPQIIVNQSSFQLRSEERGKNMLCESQATLEVSQINNNYQGEEFYMKENNNSAIFQPSLLAQSQNFNCSEKLEQENLKLQQELKQIKQEMMQSKEKTTATELQLKKDILHLQIQLTQQLGISSSQKDLQTTQLSQLMLSQNQSFSNPAVNPLPALNTRQNSQTNFGNQNNLKLQTYYPQNNDEIIFEGQSQQNLENINVAIPIKIYFKEQISQLVQAPLTTTPQKKLSISTIENNRYGVCTQRLASEDSPSLLYSTVGEESLPCNSNTSNHLIRINRQPIMQIMKQ